MIRYHKKVKLVIFYVVYKIPFLFSHIKIFHSNEFIFIVDNAFEEISFKKKGKKPTAWKVRNLFHEMTISCLFDTVNPIHTKVNNVIKVIKVLFFATWEYERNLHETFILRSEEITEFQVLNHTFFHLKMKCLFRSGFTSKDICCCTIVHLFFEVITLLTYKADIIQGIYIIY